MTYVSKLTGEQWAEAARLRQEGASYRLVARALGITPSAVRQHAQKHGWPGCAPPSARTLRKRSFIGASMAQRRRLIRRLYDAIDVRLTLMEQRMQQQLAILQTDGAPAAPGENEREARAIGTLIRNLDKVTEYAAALEADARGGSTIAAAALASEADAFRRDIAERIAKLIPAR
jgi:predicted transcriptional regulator